MVSKGYTDSRYVYTEEGEQSIGYALLPYDKGPQYADYRVDMRIHELAGEWRQWVEAYLHLIWRVEYDLKLSWYLPVTGHIYGVGIAQMIESSDLWAKEHGL